MRVVSSSEMLTIEQTAEHQQGLQTSLLMDRAGAAVAEYAVRLLPRDGNVLVVSGKGNNGGDGFVAAQLLFQQGYHVTVFMLAASKELSTIALAAFKKLSPKVTCIDIVDFERLDHTIRKSDLIIDAIFGFSLKGAVRGPASEVIGHINDSQKLILSVDLPSGLEADTGKVYGACVVADTTITFTAPKIGMLLHPGREYAGEIITADIGISEDILFDNSRIRVLNESDISAMLPYRSELVHKKSVGQVLIIAGSRGMPGAAILAGKGAYRMGAGVVTYASPQSITPVINTSLHEAIVKPQVETDLGTLSADAYSSILELADMSDAVAIGPGLTTNPQTVELVQRLVAGIDKPMVIDADGLNALRDNPGILKKRINATVITPHAGELARLFGATALDISEDRFGYAKRASAELGVVSVLKGANTLICNMDETTVNATGNPGLATAGTGDVLTGIIAALIAQGVESYNAAAIGVYLHGLSGDLASENLNEFSVMAGDVIEYLPKAINIVRER